jgi:hypothetical protein
MTHLKFHPIINHLKTTFSSVMSRFTPLLLKTHDSQKHHPTPNEAKIQEAIKFCEKMNIPFYKEDVVRTFNVPRETRYRILVVALRDAHIISLIMWRHEVANQSYLRRRKWRHENWLGSNLATKLGWIVQIVQSEMSWVLWTIISVLLAEKIESANRQLNVDLNESQSWKSVESYWLTKEWIATAVYLKWMRNSAYYIENLSHSSIYWSLIFWFIEIHLRIETFFVVTSIWSHQNRIFIFEHIDLSTISKISRSERNHLDWMTVERFDAKSTNWWRIDDTNRLK